MNTFDENTRTIQNVCLDIFIVFKDLCEKNGLKYFISGGTLLGCVRHGGFIPWDDDMDIAMPRDDYEKLISIANDQFPDYIRLDHYSLHSSTIPLTHHVQILDKRTLLIKDWTTNKNVTSVWLDVYPLDGLPNNFLARFFHIVNALLKWFSMQAIWFKDNVNIVKKRPFYQKFFMFFMKLVPASKTKTIIKRIDKFDRVSKKYPFDSSDKICSFHGMYGKKEILKREWFEKSMNMDFEGVQCRIPVEYDALLKHFYGDYKIEKRVDQKHRSFVVKI